MQDRTLSKPRLLHKLLEEYEADQRELPDDLNLLMRLGRLHIRNEGYADAIRVFQRVLTIAPDHLTAKLETALCFAAMKQFEEARFRLERVLEEHQGVPAVFLAFARLAEMQGKVEEQAESLMRAVQTAPDRPEIRVRLADVMKKHGDFSGAEREYLEALRLNPGLENARFSLAMIRMRQKRLNEAMEQFRLVIADNPSAYDAHYNLGYCLFLQKKYQLALASFSVAMRGGKEKVSAQYFLAQCWFHLGDWDRSLVLMEKLAETDGENPEILTALGKLYQKTGEIDLARDVYRRLATAFPEKTMFSLKYVRLLGDLKQYSEADRVLEQLFFNHPGHLEGHRLLGDLLFERGKFKAALEEFKRTLLISEAYLPGYHGMAKVFAKLGDPEGEYEVLLKIHGQEPNRPEVLLRLGILERALKKPASLERFRRVLEIAPESVQGSEARYFIRHTAAR